jgi:hydroxymethylbilane synthase
MILDVPLSKVGGKGLFVKEIEEALLSKRIDLAVHSMKDVPTDLPGGLEISCITQREDPRDAFLSVMCARFEDLPKGALVGTSSLRRQTQLLGLRPDLSIGQLRGNLDTRIRKMEEGRYDAIVLAAAGLRRLGWDGKIRQYLPVDVSIPAIGQGALGIEIRSDDGSTREAVAFLDDRETSLAVRAERGFLKRLEGGCQVPIAAHGTVSGDTVVLSGLIGKPDGSRILRGSRSGSVSDPEAIGVALAEELLSRGGREILDEVYRQSGS